ncbi:MAG: tetratricopeptide repeat protein [Candidatus Eisenbacteria sp.]|nr:tetratricopeptide repeat protein [Candidatus Eisenbacteria bacterium]
MRIGILTIALAVAALAMVLGIDRVGEGEAVVVLSRFGGSSHVLLEGTHWTAPLIHRKGRYPLGQSSLSVSIPMGRITSSEGEPVGLDLVVEIELAPHALPPLHAELGSGFRTRITEEVTARAGQLLDGFPLSDIYLLRWSEVGAEISQSLADTPLGKLSGLRSVEVTNIHVEQEARRSLFAELGKSGTSRVAILGIDGADWNIIEPMFRRGELPHLRRLVDGGVRADLESIYPLLSPLIWTSIVTGKTPDKHGILDFFAEDPATGKQVPVTSNLRRVQALWNILSEAGINVTFVDWMASWPAEPVEGVMVSDRLAFHAFDPSPENYAGNRKTYPEDLWGSLAPLVVQDRDVTYREVKRFLKIQPSEFDAHPGGRYDPSDPIQNFRLIHATTETYRRVGLKLQKRPARLFGIYFELLDAVCHLFIRHMPPAMEGISAEDARKFGGAVEEIYRYQDEILGDFLAQCDERTTVIVISDHGFRSGPLRLRSDSRIHGMGGAAAEWHRLHGLLVMHGPHLQRGAVLEHASVLDITPTVLYMLGLPVASDMDGVVLTEAFARGFVENNPVLRIPSYESGETSEPQAPVASPDDTALRERLAALGYVEKDGANVHNNLAQSYLERGEFEKALAEYRRALEFEPASARLWSNLGMAYLRMEAYEEAVEPLNRALELKPDFEAALSNLAVAYTYLEKLEDAARVMERAIDLEPGRAEFHDNLGVIYTRLGKKDKALECLRTAAALEPKFPEPYNNLGAIAMETGALQEARENFRRAMALSPSFFDAPFNFGLLEHTAGNLSESAAYFRMALEIRPRHLEARYRLGEVYSEMGEDDKALREWNTVVTIDPDGPTGQKAAARISD